MTHIDHILTSIWKNEARAEQKIEQQEDRDSLIERERDNRAVVICDHSLTLTPIYILEEEHNRLYIDEEQDALQVVLTPFRSILTGKNRSH